MRTAKIVIELEFHIERVPKQVLEEMVMHFSGRETELCKPFLKYDPSLSCRVFYEDFAGKPQINLLEMFKIGRKKVSKDAKTQIQNL